jgi:DNA-binding MarR family transcriptional regulator
MVPSVNTRKKSEKPARSPKPKAKDQRRDQALTDARKRASTGQLLVQCARIVSDVATKRAAEAKGGGLKSAHAALLPQLDFEGVRIVDLALRLGITKQAVSQTVGELVESGVVELAADPDDGRAKRVRFTKKGADAVTHELNVMGKVEAELEKKIGQKHMRALHAALVAVDEALASEA